MSILKQFESARCYGSFVIQWFCIRVSPLGIQTKNILLIIALGLTLQSLYPVLLTAENHDDPESCVSRFRDASVSLNNDRDTKKVYGLTPLISIPVEGHLQLSVDGVVQGDPVWSPTGDFTFSVGPYDAASKRLYSWGYFDSGWIEVFYNDTFGYWQFGESDTLRPKLYEPADDIEDVQLVHISSALGVLFYSGFTAPHWLTGSQSYRVYRIDGQEMARLQELEDRKMWYVGDDLINGLAIFAPLGARWSDKPNALMAYDGNQIFDNETNFGAGWCHVSD